MIKVLVADSYPVVRLGVKAILSGVEDVAGIDEAGSEQEILDKAKKNLYDVILFEVARPAGNGLNLLRELKNKNPKVAVLIFTHLPEDEFILRALKLGAAGYLSKQSDPEDLIAAIQKIAQGKKFISDDLAELLANYLDSSLDKPLHETLSDREYQVLALMASGKRQRDIADSLSLTQTTIRRYQEKIYSKMQISNKSELIRYAIKSNLVGNEEDRPAPFIE
jgi:two-component system, NarL family, invasion response regulator UvrY